MLIGNLPRQKAKKWKKFEKTDFEKSGFDKEERSQCLQGRLGKRSQGGTLGGGFEGKRGKGAARYLESQPREKGPEEKKLLVKRFFGGKDSRAR